jgi:hypothetical protein
MRSVVGGRTTDRATASTSEIACFETEALSSPTNIKRLMDARLPHPRSGRKKRGRLGF